MSEEIAQLLQKGIAAARAGNKALARRLLLEVTDRDERNEEAWLWLSGVVEDLEESKLCLQNVLTINPTNERARQGLAWVEQQLARRAPPPPLPFEAPPPIEEQIAATGLLPEVPAEEEEVAPPENRIPCPACGAMNFDFATECVKCNFPFAITCPACGDYVPTDTGLCPSCGAELPLPQKLTGVREKEAQIEDAYRQGLAYLEKGRYQEAKASLELAIERDPSHVEAIYSLGEACANLGLTEEARQYWEEVRMLQPDHPYAERALESLLSPAERRRQAREQRKARQEQARQKKREEKEGRPPGQTLLSEFERKMEETPPPEEEAGALESFLYALMIGLVIGVAYALNFGIEGQPTREEVPAILKQSVVVALLVVAGWIVLGVAARLLSLLFKAEGKTSGYMVSAARFLIPFLWLLLPVLVSVPQVSTLLPDALQHLLKRLPQAPWLLFGGLALCWGLFLFLRGVSRVGRIPLWKGGLAGLLALLVAAAAVYGFVLFAYEPALTYVDTLWPATPTGGSPTPAPTPGG